MSDADPNITEPPNPGLEWFLHLISADSMDVIFQELVDRSREWMDVPRSALWWLDSHRNGFRLITAGQDSRVIDQEANFFPYDVASDLGLLSGGEPVELPADTKFRLPDLDLINSLATLIHYNERATGILIVFPWAQSHSWSEEARHRLRTIARNGAELCCNFEERDKLRRLIELLQEMSEKTQHRELYDLILRDGRLIVRDGKGLLTCDRAVVRGVNLKDGHLTYEDSTPRAPEGFPLSPGEGITGLALQNNQTYRISDVTDPDWQNVYRALWPSLLKTRSELAVPIVHRKYRVRVKTRNMLVDKPFGVLNFESPTVAAFSSLDQECAEVIAQRMAPVMERIEYDVKLGKVRQASQDLATKRDWDSIVDTLLAAIRDALGYEFVSLSIVDQNAKVIRCVRVIGLPGDENNVKAVEFRRDAVHELAGPHVQADVVRRGWTDVPDPEDPRLSEISKKFGLDQLIRVFVPMKATAKEEVIGTVSAGYDRTYRKHIYWRDVQLLRILVNFGTNAMQTWHRGNVDRVTHEMNAPLTAVRGNLDRLRRRRNRLSNDQIDVALEDMETDTQLLYYQVQQLEYVVAGKVAEVAKRPLHLESVLLFRDIIFKTIFQLKKMVIDNRLDPKNISYSGEDIHKIKPLYVDKTKISQVIFNLFTNAVKYVKTPETFQIRIEAEETTDSYIIKFSDWGIGVPEGLDERIFADRFRAPVGKEILGSGLGLTIARELMREHGGDLILKNRQHPTEFQLIFPKHLRRRHENNVY
jgi:signal transduction histidine kinase/GAF domain-containing protein